MTDEDGGAAIVSVTVTSERRRVEIRGLKSGPTAFYIDADEKLEAIINALTGAAGIYVHMPDGCEDDGCPCYARGAGR